MLVLTVISCFVACALSCDGGVTEWSGCGGLAVCVYGCKFVGLFVWIGEYHQLHQTTNNEFRYWPWNVSQCCYPRHGMAICFWRIPGSPESWIDFSPTPPKFGVFRNHSRESESNNHFRVFNK